MREILFRGKAVTTGEWVQGDLNNHKNGKVYIRNWSPDEDGAYIAVEIDLTTVGQYTGMKDCDGRRIFEGDILQQKKNGVYGLPFYVKYDDGAFNWVEGNRCDYLYSSICETCKVVGNVHDNPELLEV